MRRFRELFVAIASALAMTSLAETRLLDQYQTIVERNPFGLKDPPPPPAPVTKVQKEEKPEEFYLTGISTIGDRKRPRAYLLSKDATKKEYDKKFYNLTVGDRQGDLSLLEVDPKGRRVKVAYLGEEKWLSMKDNGVPAPTGPAPANPAIPNPGMIPGQPGAVPVPLPTAGNPPTQPARPYPNASSGNRRTPRTANGGYTPGGFSAPPAGTIGNILQKPGGVRNVPAELAQGPQTDAEVAAQVINMHANYQHAIQQGQVSPPIPPVP